MIRFHALRSAYIFTWFDPLRDSTNIPTCDCSVPYSVVEATVYNNQHSESYKGKDCVRLFYIPSTDWGGLGFYNKYYIGLF